jgi:hypothetical protein
MSSLTFTSDPHIVPTGRVTNVPGTVAGTVAHDPRGRNARWVSCGKKDDPHWQEADPDGKNGFQKR